MIKNAVNEYVNTLKENVNVKQKVIMIKTFSRSVNIFTNFFKLVKKFFME